ncbi:MAG TPA: hypothetical protein VEU33_28960 [Archangium sp.]|nr:hypothetical protein [Archangium sp.]
MLPFILAGAAVAAAVPVGASVVLSRKPKSAAGASLAGLPSEKVAALEVTPPTEAEPAKPTNPLSSLLKGAGAALSVGKVAAAGLGVSAGVAAAGVLAASASGQVVDKLLGQGEGRGNLAAARGPAALPVVAAQAAVEKIGAALKVDPKLSKDIGHIVAAGPLAAPVAQLKLINAGVEAVAKAIGGDKGVQSVKTVVHAFDPTRKDTPAGAVVGAVGGFLKNIIPIPKPTPSAPPKPLINLPAIRLPVIKLPFGLGKK